MRSKPFSFATLSRLSAVIMGLMVLVGCSSSSSTTVTPPPGSPAVTLSPTSLSFTIPAGTVSAAQKVTVTNSGSATLTFTTIVASDGFSQTNTCGTSISAGGACTISVTFVAPATAGTVNGNLAITDNASGSPHMVTLTGVSTSVSLTPTALTFSGVTVGSHSAPQTVTLKNTANVALAISSIAVTAGSSDFSQTNTCGNSVAASGSCTINVTFTPPTSGTLTGTLTVTDNAGGVAGSTQTVALTGTASGSNTAQVTAGFGLFGNAGSTATNYYNGLFTTVTVCEPGTTTCVAVPNVLVDTGSVGLRVLSSALAGVTLTPLNDGSGDTLDECTQYGDGSFNWGPVALATVQIGGETASQVPASAGGTANSGVGIQVISTSAVPSSVQASGQCSPSNNTPDEDTTATLGANGILGIGNFPQDCGVNCTTSGGVAQITDPYWLCPSNGSCGQAVVPYADQVWNPVAAFSSTDTNGVVIQLPSPAAGQDTVTGTLTFGIGTQSNNALGSATVYELDGSGNFESLLFHGITYTSANSFGSFLDSGSNALFVSDPTTLTSASGVTTVNCADNGFYCPSSTLSLDITLAGSNGTSAPVTLSIANADSLFSNCPACEVFTNLGGATLGGTGPSTDQFDLGLPYFLGKTIFVGIAATNSSYPNGYWAF